MSDKETPPSPAKQAPAKKATPKPEEVSSTPVEETRRAGGYVDRGDGNGWVLDEL